MTNRILAALALVLCAVVSLLYLDVEPQNPSIRQAIRNAGGLTAVNAQAQRIFDRLNNTNEVVLESEMAEAPLLRQLGNSVMAFGEKGDRPAHIRVRRGGHFTTYFFFIFDPRKPTPPQLPNGLQQLLDNIYAAR